ncbi:exodeoxyribonuclease VII large subunit [Methanothermobacter sp. K4]|uniref:exodeoxyribonuclease VII large subunit n=1 Tax=Methanothermobacter sp. K4 TaxID=2913262 RepID=UPI001EDB74E5|nr:exodeoxyribonuclease VII large subunit [Methanothermobacter sp. K4]MCG2827789.1 exodeoxyribonuclease VII large subunit [Methanothermobacter sp. K4]
MGFILDDRALLIISVFLGISGFIGMIISSASLTPPIVRVSDMDRSMMDREITVEGTVESVHELKSGTLLLKINDGTGTVTAVAFKSVSEGMEISPGILRGMRIQVTGRVKEYRGSLEMVVEKPSAIRPKSFGS